MEMRMSEEVDQEVESRWVVMKKWVGLCFVTNGCCKQSDKINF